MTNIGHTRNQDAQNEMVRPYERALSTTATPQPSREKAIKDFCQRRGISYLVHFTRCANLEGIFRYGILSVQELHKRRINVIANDRQRLDGCTTASCLSIGFPNYKMFYPYRCNNQTDWAVLVLDASILWEQDCAFCNGNAASNAVRRVPLSERRQSAALAQLYGNHPDAAGVSRAQVQIPPYYPTHPQAEVLVFDAIPTHYIKAVHFKSASALSVWLPPVAGQPACKFEAAERFFWAREDYRLWK